MRILNKIIYSVLFLSLLTTNAQEIKMNEYTFGEGFNFSTSNGNTMQISTYFQPYFESRSYEDAQDFGGLNRFRIRRARLRLDGKSNNSRFSYRFQVDLTGSGEADNDLVNNYLLDACVSYDVSKQISITFGQRATYTDNRELLMNSSSLQLVDRSRLTSAFATIREFGLFVDGNFKLGGTSYLRPYFVLTNGDGQSIYGKDRGGLKVGGRVDYLPFGLFSNFGQFRQVDIVRELTPKFVIGTTYSINQGISSRAGRESGEILYLNALNEESLPDYSKFGIDFLFKYKGFSCLGEFVKSWTTVPSDITQRVRTNGTVTSDFEINGVQNKENYIKNRMILGSAYNLQMGYILKSGVSIDARYTHLKADEFSFLNNGTFYNRPDHYTIGITKYIARNYGAKIQADCTYMTNNGGIDNLNGTPISGNEWITRLILSLSL